MEKTLILHFITPAKNASPFDANMAYDAGYEAVIPYTGVTLEEVRGLVQDCIFSRGPRGVWRTGMFIGGRDVNLAMDMLAAAKSAMVPPFEVSVFADPSGAFTTSAVAVAMVERSLFRAANVSLAGQKVKIFGATGPVGLCTAVLAAQNGADVSLVSHTNFANAQETVASFGQRFNVTLHCVDGGSEDKKREVVRDADVVLCCSAAGIRVVTLDMLREATSLKVIADVNAVPPTGVEGVGVMDDHAPVAGTNAVGIGALAIGNYKYQTQQAMFRQMVDGQTHLYHDLFTAFDVARKLVG